MKIEIAGWATGADGEPIPIDAALQVEHDGLRLGVCLAIADRLVKYPGFRMQGLRTGLTANQADAVKRYRAERR